jgi:hypothetical protein
MDRHGASTHISPLRYGSLARGRVDDLAPSVGGREVHVSSDTHFNLASVALRTIGIATAPILGMELIAGDVEAFHLGVADLDAFW